MNNDEMNNKQDNKSDKNSDKNPDKKRKIRFSRILIIFILAAIVTYFGVTFVKSCYKKYTTSEISYSSFIEMIDNGEIKSVKYSSDKIVITPKEQPVKGITMTHYTGYMYDEETFNRLKEMKDIEVKVEIEDTGTSIIDFLLVYILPFVFVYGIIALTY